MILLMATTADKLSSSKADVKRLGKFSTIFSRSIIKSIKCFRLALNS